MFSVHFPGCCVALRCVAWHMAWCGVFALLCWGSLFQVRWNLQKPFLKRPLYYYSHSFFVDEKHFLFLDSSFRFPHFWIPHSGFLVFWFSGFPVFRFHVSSHDQIHEILLLLRFLQSFRRSLTIYTGCTRISYDFDPADKNNNTRRRHNHHECAFPSHFRRDGVKRICLHPKLKGIS